MQGFDGRTAAHAIPPLHVKSMLEQEGLGEESICEQFCAAVKAYCDGKIKEYNMWTIIGAKHVIRHGCCLQHSDLLTDLRIQGIDI